MLKIRVSIIVFTEIIVNTSSGWYGSIQNNKLLLKIYVVCVTYLTFQLGTTEDIITCLHPYMYIRKYLLQLNDVYSMFVKSRDSRHFSPTFGSLQGCCMTKITA